MFLMAWAALEDGDLIEIRNFIRHSTRVSSETFFPLPEPTPPTKTSGAPGSSRTSKSPQKKASPNRGRSPKGKSTSPERKPSTADSQNNNNRTPNTPDDKGGRGQKTSGGTETPRAASTGTGSGKTEETSSPSSPQTGGGPGGAPQATVLRFRADGSSFHLQLPKNFGSWREGSAERARLARRAHEANPSTETEAAVKDAEAKVDYIKKLQGTRGKDTPVTQDEFVAWLDHFGNSFRSAPPPRTGGETKTSN